MVLVLLPKQKGLGFLEETHQENSKKRFLAPALDLQFFLWETTLSFSLWLIL
jgi:hypothetical protein